MKNLEKGLLEMIYVTILVIALISIFINLLACIKALSLEDMAKTYSCLSTIGYSSVIYLVTRLVKENIIKYLQNRSI